MSVKGKTNNPNGRPKGVPNKATSKFKEALNRLLEDNSENLKIWLETIASESPKDAVDLILKFAEYAHPKLARVDNRLIDSEGRDRDFLIEVTRKVVHAKSGDK